MKDKSAKCQTRPQSWLPDESNLQFLAQDRDNTYVIQYDQQEAIAVDVNGSLIGQ
jgi:hypothetical protein